MFHPDPDRKPRGKVHPVECPVDVGKSGRNLAIFRKDCVTNTLHHSTEFAVGMLHQIDVDAAAAVKPWKLMLLKPAGPVVVVVGVAPAVAVVVVVGSNEAM